MALTKKQSKITTLDDEEGGLGEWYSEHSQMLNWVLGIALVGIIGWKGYDYFRTSRIEEANSALSTVQKDYVAAINEADAEKRKKSLNDLVPKAEGVASAHQTSGVGRQAQLLAANTLYQSATLLTGQEASAAFEKAREAFQKYVESATNDHDRAVGQLGLGNCLENLGFLNKNDLQKTKDAIDAYKKVEEAAPGTYLAAEAKIAQARLLQAQEGRQEDARKLYTEVAANRKVPEKLYKEEDTTQTLQNGQEVTPEQISEIRSLKGYSYERVAEKAIERLPSLPTSKPD